MLNPDISYLLGMIVGKGEIIRDNKETQIIINIPHKNLEIEGEDTQQSIRASLLDMVGRLKILVGTYMDWDTTNPHEARITFSKPNGDYLIRDITSYLQNKTTWKDFRIPEEIFSTSEDNKIEFLRGLADVTAHIRKSNSAYGINYNHRVYFEIVANWDLVIDIANLLKTVDIPVHTIRFAHPNIVDPNLKKYNAGSKEFWNKEHQIKIWAEEFEKVGFNIDHKNKLLKKFADLNRTNWKNRKKTISEIHHKFYWETREKEKEKPEHPEEKSSKLPEKVRKHFNSWTDIAIELGYHG